MYALSEFRPINNNDKCHFCNKTVLELKQLDKKIMQCVACTILYCPDCSSQANLHKREHLTDLNSLLQLALQNLTSNDQNESSDDLSKVD